MEQDVILSASHVSRDFRLPGGHVCHALRDTGIQVDRGSLVILKGRSGSGKTTMLNLLGGLDPLEHGEIRFDGQDYRTMSREALEKMRRYQIGFVFQSVALIPNMSAYENIEFALRLADSKVDWKQRVNHLLEMVDLSGRGHHIPAQLSGGERQRIAIARAMAHRPKLLIADEPTGALDTAMGLHIMELFRQFIREEQVTILMTTHDPGLMELADVVYEMEDGEIIGREENHPVL